MTAKKKRVIPKRIPRVETGWDRISTIILSICAGLMLGMLIFWSTYERFKQETETMRCPACQGKGELRVPVYYMDKIPVGTNQREDDRDPD
jgi:hypothetical protein